MKLKTQDTYFKCFMVKSCFLLLKFNPVVKLLKSQNWNRHKP